MKKKMPPTPIEKRLAAQLQGQITGADGRPVPVYLVENFDAFWLRTTFDNLMDDLLAGTRTREEVFDRLDAAFNKKGRSGKPEKLLLRLAAQEVIAGRVGSAKEAAVWQLQEEARASALRAAEEKFRAAHRTAPATPAQVAAFKADRATMLRQKFSVPPGLNESRLDNLRRSIERKVVALQKKR